MYVVLDIRYLIIYVELRFAAILVKYCRPLSDSLGFVYYPISLYNLFGALYSLSMLCIIFWGFPPPGPTGAAAAVAPRQCGRSRPSKSAAAWKGQ